MSRNSRENVLGIVIELWRDAWCEQLN